MALRLIACGLVTVGLLTSIESIRRLIMEIPAGKSRYGLALAAISAIVLTLLAVRKQRVARLVSSSALKADSYLSAVGAALAGITLVSGVLVTLGEVPWIDAIAALIVSVVATTVGVTEFTREARTLRSVKRANATLISTQRGR
jgi:divalent metal cation (Fe/Co/Zn/Cd) transporter